MKDRVRPSLGRLLARSLSVLASNGIVLYGVAFFGWNRAGVVLLFILEGVIVFLLDIVRYRGSRVRKAFAANLFFEGVFIFFFGFFALIVFGPYESLEAMLGDGFRVIFRLVVELRFAVFAILFFRLVQLGQDLLAAGIFGGPASRPLLPQGGGWMFLLFFAVMLAPLISRAGAQSHRRSHRPGRAEDPGRVRGRLGRPALYFFSGCRSRLNSPVESLPTTSHLPTSFLSSTLARPVRYRLFST